jgi:hypothetical protein
VRARRESRSSASESILFGGNSDEMGEDLGERIRDNACEVQAGEGGWEKGDASDFAHQSVANKREAAQVCRV